MSLSASPTVSRLGYREHIRLVNALAWASQRVGFDLGHLDRQSLLSAARRQTGLEDFGDPWFMEPMGRIVEELQRAEGITALARIIMRQSLLLATRHRLQQVAWLAGHPEVHQQPIVRPIFVLGFPRTGTTLLQNLLALDPRRRGLQFWELTLPIPVVENRATDRARRRRQATWILRAAYQMAPEMAQVHYIDIDTLEECWPLFGTSFAVFNWDLQTGLAAWGDYLMQDVDMRVPYREYRTTLQLLTERFPAEQLVLKCPEHLFFIDALLDAFPDACIVQTHRDPYPVIGSYSSLISLQWRNLYGHIDRPRIGAHMTDRLHRGVQRAMEARDRADPARFYDVRFADLIEDPGKVVRDIASHFELDLAPDHEAQVQRYLASERQDAPGNHQYDPSHFGLEPARVRDRYRGYIERFGIEVKEGA